MSQLTNRWPLLATLRIRLTFWYMFSFSIILVLFAALLYIQLRYSLIAQVDTALQLAAVQALINLDEDVGRLAFQNIENNPEAVSSLSDDYYIQLSAPDGTVWETLGGNDGIPALNSPTEAFSTLIDGQDQWRVYSREVIVGDTAGWLQVVQELETVQSTLQSLLAQMLWGLPLATLLAGLGGFLLASRALRPVDRMTRTAQSITASDLNQRIDYIGPADEIGRLAQTFDNMLDRLQSAFERERRFTGDAAHELRTPLAAIKGRIGVTLSRPREKTNYTETLQDVEQQVDRLIRLSSDLLYIARLDRAQLEHQSELIELDDFLGAIVDQVRPLAEVKSVTLEESIPEGLMVKGSMDLLIRLYLNLLDNAIKYTPPAGQVTVWARKQRDEIQIGVSDTGPGIATEYMPHLFERFYRAEEDRARNWTGDGQGGAGLGLAIAYEITRVHGGTLSVQSEVGQGTTFITHLSASVDSTRIFSGASNLTDQ